jgi:hypothetical protein
MNLNEADLSIDFIRPQANSTSPRVGARVGRRALAQSAAAPCSTLLAAVLCSGRTVRRGKNKKRPLDGEQTAASRAFCSKADGPVSASSCRPVWVCQPSSKRECTHRRRLKPRVEQQEPDPAFPAPSTLRTAKSGIPCGTSHVRGCRPGSRDQARPVSHVLCNFWIPFIQSISSERAS